MKAEICRGMVAGGMLAVWMFMAASWYQKDLALKEAWQHTDQLIQLHKEEREAWHTLYLTVTAYTASVDECDSTPDQTAIMEKPIPGATCAVSPDLSHLLGKKVYVDGIGVLKVNDLTNKRYKKRLDIVVKDKQSARKHGVKSQKKVVVL